MFKVVSHKGTPCINVSNVSLSLSLSLSRSLSHKNVSIRVCVMSCLSSKISKLSVGGCVSVLVVSEEKNKTPFPQESTKIDFPRSRIRESHRQRTGHDATQNTTGLLAYSTHFSGLRSITGGQQPPLKRVNSNFTGTSVVRGVMIT